MSDTAASCPSVRVYESTAFISSIILSMPEEYENINKIIDIINNSKILMSINNFFKISFYIEKIFI